MARAVILVNPNSKEETELYQPRRLFDELKTCGVASDVLPNAFLAHTGRERAEEALTEKYAFCVYLDKDKYAPRILEKRGMRLFNRGEAVETCDDKMLTHIALSGVVPMPETYFAPLCYKEESECPSVKEIGERLRYPVVVKECYGSFGRQVYLAQNEEELQALSRKLKLRPHLYQEFVGRSKGRDLRAICIGGEIVACMERRNESDFRSNLALGGKGEKFTPDEEVRTLCRRVSETLRLDYCGIDLLFSERGMLVCEVNSNAFFGGIERSTGVNVAKAYAEYMCQTMGI